MEGTHIGELLGRLEAAARAKKLTKKDLARLAELHQNTLRNFRGYQSRAKPDAPAWSPSVETVARLEAILLPHRRPQPAKG